MREEFTPAVQRALDAALAWAQRLNHHGVNPLTAMLGLLDEEEGTAAEFVVGCGVALDQARHRLTLVAADQSLGTWADALTAAAEAARLLSGERTIGGQHLAIGILQTSETIRSELIAAGLNWPQVKARVSDVAMATLAIDSPLDLSDSPDRMDLVRIVDASANRAREALRVIEDYCRFVLDDAYLCREFKQLRHQLVEALPDLPLSVARDTLNDVGTSISTTTELHRDSVFDVVQTNLKRLQEALRSLEEYGKVASATVGPALERLRYRSYVLERSIVLRRCAQPRLDEARLYLLVTGAHCATSLDFLIAEAAAGGVDIVQLREKSLPDRELLDRARRLRQMTRKAGVLFIINDRPDIARLVEADGVHLGQNDLPVHEARRILGSDGLIGVSTHSIDQLRRAIEEGASYVGIGPVFPSTTKTFEELAGLEYIQQATAETSLPAFALGGITPDNLPQVIAAGARRIAVSSIICRADEPHPIAHALRQQLDRSTRCSPPNPR